MHDIEPFFSWRHLYISEEDKRSVFYKKQHSEFEYSDTIYNYYIHPQWDFFGSNTLYLKIIYVDYELQFCIIEFIGEWNDAINNDVMTLKRNIVDDLLKEGITKYILITENILNFHSSDKEYYEEWYENVMDENGWIIAINMNIATQHDFLKKKLQRYVELIELPNWRVFKPHHLFEKLDEMINKRLN